jgi:hypothetical protein
MKINIIHKEEEIIGKFVVKTTATGVKFDLNAGNDEVIAKRIIS